VTDGAAPEQLRSRVGVEIELLTPRGTTRADLAGAIAGRVGGGVVPVFHRDSEPSAVPGMSSFRHLTRGFAVLDAAGAEVCSVVDDITIVAGLDVRATPLPGWHRIVTDDARLLNLLAGVCDPAAGLDEVLEPVAALFGTRVERAGAIRRVTDRDGASVAMAAPLPGERHRPAEIVTVPLAGDHAAALERLLAPARELGCTVPVEAAVHLHFDAAPFRTPRAFANLVELFSAWRPALWRLLATNPRCKRLAAPPAELVQRCAELRDMDGWAQVTAAVAEVGLSKYSDLNLTHLVRAPAVKDTLEVRVLPGADTAEDIMGRAAVVEGLLERCRTGPGVPGPSGRVDDDAAALARWASG
jgi:putative amidoligase enzyme